ncbi:SDR family NAD(P)-dependent oxidoreductase [Arthrobacter sp. W4I7]|uniref:SDR family NAD(P)-dependent oxidoreductase n=1 Tax=Arthrobacter sp. W4I7 TaxID=3042296 RepID=UPI002788BAEE|nr:SDR family NAD(P)-dependent oxidoreductase [Arthrobacter sp. W4I7]MDQ0689064.1 NAD(P)-dependent dehydrogenase (short-subunit alcohol dehydrogenase family) [Arthrobacter sp. W4I7]
MNSIIIIGAGPGIGAAVARRFARENFSVALVARKQETLQPIITELSEAGCDVIGELADAANEEQLAHAITRIEQKHGVPAALVYNAAIVRRDKPGELGREGLLASWETNVLGGMRAAVLLGEKMAAPTGGTILFTGGMPKPSPALTSLSLSKTALRALAEILGHELGPKGVHVATVTVSGGPVASGGPYDPDEIAEHYWRLHQQKPADWQHEVVH